MRKLLLFLFLVMSGSVLKAQSLQLDSTLLTIAVAVDSTKITAPWDIEWGFDNRLWMTDCKTIKAWNPTTNSMKTIYRFNKAYGLGLAVPKTLPSSGPTYVYAAFDSNSYYAAGQYIRLYRFEYSAAQDTLINPVVLLGYHHPGEHSGGKVIIAQDGKIMIISPEYTFSNDTLGANNGRTLRINPDGSYPAGNLRPDRTYTIGHRNSQGMVQLPDGKIIASEHSGPSTEDEINLITPSGHYGWPAMDGNSHCTGASIDSCNSQTFLAAHKKPIYRGSTTPAGIDYYDHPAIPEWRNCLIVGTLYQPDSCLAVFKFNNNHDSILARRNYLKKNAGGLNDFKRTRDICVAPDGSIYCLVLDRSFQFIGNDSIINKGTKIVRLKNNAYTPPPATISAIVPGLCKIYPNPASNAVTVEMANYQKPIAYTVSDQQGKLIAKGTLTQKRTHINTANWAPGIYEFVTDARQKETMKIVIAH